MGKVKKKEKKIEISPQKEKFFLKGLSMVEYGRQPLRHHTSGAALTTKKRNVLITPYMHTHTTPKMCFCKRDVKDFCCQATHVYSSVKTHEIVVSTSRAYH